ncbi:hypothetical protein M4I21_14030 [Cellulophaga sp. 20_2_10]|uniref:hypothetical protein n=1 Tax=Cellulophaga sp. 20_2_10 TaxID=2942476 RepID=UPI00201A35DD|nr:hypothetical protein [Cellulophaga sp. 20_2_10]MCL5246937.1 hypothetical protein [Cellulophaga sp. 20_2_10]
MPQENNNSNQDKRNYGLLKFAMIAGLILFYVVQWFGPGLIKNYKQNKEFQNIHYGGDQSALDASVERYNQAIMDIRHYTDSITNKNSSLHIYTNDTTELTASIRPNINYDVFNEYGFPRPVIQKNNAITAELNRFLKNRDSLGYNIILNTKKGGFYLKRLVNNNKETEYVTFSTYYYNSKEKDHLKELINKKNNYTSILQSKEEKIRELDSLQKAKIIFTETELDNQKIKSGLKLIMGPRIKLKDSTHLFYFTAYSNSITKEHLKTKLQNFVPLFLKKQDTTNCFIKEVTIIRPTYDDDE